MTKISSAAAVLFMALAFVSANAVHAADKPTPPTSGGSLKCKGDETYNPRICGGSVNTIPSYCLDGKKVMQGYYIQNGKCRQDNGG